MSENPFAPPGASLDHAAPPETAPALWNPGAAAAWSLLFSPVFGAFLHMHNWESLGDSARAATARTWAIVSLLVLLGGTTIAILLPESKTIDRLTNAMGLLLLLAWYFAAGRAQSRFVAERFGSAYPRKGWAKPLGLGLLFLVALVVVSVVVGFAAALAGIGPPLE